jgi:hypothetical protein
MRAAAQGKIDLANNRAAAQEEEQHKTSILLNIVHDSMYSQASKQQGSRQQHKAKYHKKIYTQPRTLHTTVTAHKLKIAVGSTVQHTIMVLWSTQHTQIKDK